jgi:hypothetical protein
MYTMNLRRSVAATLFVGSIAFVTPQADAATILPNCATCGNHNTAWDLTLALIDDANNTYQLTVTATYGNPADFVFVNAIAFKIDAFTGEYDTTPTVQGPAESGWTVVSGGISAGGCSGSGSGFYCANSTGSGATRTGSTDTWTFQLNVDNSLPNLSTYTGSFKAHFTNADDGKVGSLLSEDVIYRVGDDGDSGDGDGGDGDGGDGDGGDGDGGDGDLPGGDGDQPADISTPEPATLVLFGTGLAAIATAIRRRRKA